MTNEYHIGDRAVPYRPKEVCVDRLAFYPENPRIYSRFSPTEEKTQEAILKKLEKMEHVKGLRAQIDRDRQVNEPLWCMKIEESSKLNGDYDYIVLEGNSRLAALLMAKSTPPATDRVPCNILDLSGFEERERESFIFSLLGRIHITGKTNWKTYENAAYIYRRHKHQYIPASEVAREVEGLSQRKVNDIVEAYELMQRNDDTKQDNWSYYQTYVSGTKTKKFRKDHSDLDSVVLQLIKSGGFVSALNMRNGIPKIMANQKAKGYF